MIKLIKKKHNKIHGHSEVTGIRINGKFFSYNKIYEVGKDITEIEYEENKELFRNLTTDK